MLTICVEMLTFSRSCCLVGGSRSFGSGSWPCSPGFGVSPGRLFFFSLEVGGWRLDCDHPGLILAPSSNNESAIPRSGYERLNLIISHSRRTKRGRLAPAGAGFHLAIRLRG